MTLKKTLEAFDASRWVSVLVLLIAGALVSVSTSVWMEVPFDRFLIAVGPFILFGAGLLALVVSWKLQAVSTFVYVLKMEANDRQRKSDISSLCFYKMFHFLSQSPDSKTTRRAVEWLVFYLVGMDEDQLRMSLFLLFNQFDTEQMKLVRAECQRQKDQISTSTADYLAKGSTQSDILYALQKPLPALDQILNYQTEAEDYAAGWRRVGELGTGEE